jgi:molecular chaperone GrpE
MDADKDTLIIEDEAPGKPQESNSLLAAKDAEIKELNERLLRLRADFDNIRKRMEREKMSLATLVEEKFLLEVLPILDSLDRAKDSYETTHSAENIYSGLELIQKQFQDTLNRMGVKKIACQGEFFDANLHCAVMSQECNDAADNSIVEVCQPGYTYKDKVIRHAQVIIAKKEERDETASGQ